MFTQNAELPGEEWMEQVKKNMNLIGGHSFGGTQVGEVLDDAMGTTGKMIRPRLLLLMSTYGPDWKEKKDRLCMLAAMVELTHLASLIHDDIVDEAPFRRGEMSVQHKYGKDAAVYAGDFLMARINYFQAVYDLNEAGKVLSQTVAQMCAGEIGQARNRYNEDVTKGQYLRNIQGKTTALFKASCRIGAMEGGCSEECIQRLEKFGEYLGILFQFRDDLLDFTSDETSVGKETHKDFRDGIYTMPVLLTLQDPEGRRALLPIMRANRECGITREQLAEMEQTVIRCGGVEATKEQIRFYSSQIDVLLSGFPQRTTGNYLRKIVRKLEVQ